MPLNPLTVSIVQRKMLRGFAHFSKKGRGISPCKFYPTKVGATEQVIRNIYHDVTSDQISSDDSYNVTPIDTFCYIDSNAPYKTIARLGFIIKEGESLPILCYMPLQSNIVPENNSLIVLLTDEGLISGRWSVSQAKSYGVNSPVLLYVCTVVPYRDNKSQRIT